MCISVYIYIYIYIYFNILPLIATLRKESKILTRELSEQKDEDKRASLAKLTHLKVEELKAAKEGWQSKLTELLEEVRIDGGLGVVPYEVKLLLFGWLYSKTSLRYEGVFVSITRQIMSKEDNLI